MAPEALVEPGARGLRIEELAQHRERMVERQEKRFSQRDRDGLLWRGQGHLQAMWRMAAVVDVVTAPPLPNRLFGNPVALGHPPDRLNCAMKRADLREPSNHPGQNS